MTVSSGLTVGSVRLDRQYSARRLMGSRLIESAAYCNQILLAQQFINSAQNTSIIESAAYCNQILLAQQFINSAQNTLIIESFGYC